MRASLYGTCRAVVTIALWDERVQGKGEDGPPLAREHRGAYLLAVLDGLGGAGARSYKTTTSREVSGARLASRVGSWSVDRWFKQLQPPFKPEVHVEVLQRGIVTALRNLRVLFASNSSRLTGKLVRHFPTTISCLVVEPDRNLVHALWAGDSRCYVLRPERGLQQLSRDDLLVANDAMENLRNESPMSNCANGEGFVLRSLSHRLDPPAAVLVATDGCFQFWPTPLHFEWLLLKSLGEANDAEEWKTKIREALRRVSGDDCSLVMTAFGWPCFGEMRASFDGRRRWLERPIRELDELRAIEKESNEVGEVSARATFEEAVAVVWSQYRETYEALIGRQGQWAAGS